MPVCIILLIGIWAVCSDGSVIFRFGNRDNETTLARTGHEQNESSSSEYLLNEKNELQFKERMELDDTSEQSKNERSESYLEETALDMKTSDLSCSKSDVHEEFVGVVVVDDDDKDTVTNNSSKVDDVLDEEIGSDFEGNPMIFCENEGIIQVESSESEATIEVLDGYTSYAISEENADTEDANLTAVSTDESDDSTFKCATTEASDDGNMIQVTLEAQTIHNEEMSPSTVDGYVDADDAKSSTVVSTYLLFAKL